MKVLSYDVIPEGIDCIYDMTLLSYTLRSTLMPGRVPYT